MSRRFGRNQRRQAREALAVQVQRTEQAKLLAENNFRMHLGTRQELDRLQEFFAIVAARVGRESILVGGEVEADLDGPEVHTFRAMVQPENQPCFHIGDMAQMEAVKLEIMRRLQVKAVRDALRQQIVVRCFIGNATAGIALSDSFLSRSTEYELQHQVAQELARCLAKAIKAAA